MPIATPMPGASAHQTLVDTSSAITEAHLRRILAAVGLAGVGGAGFAGAKWLLDSAYNESGGRLPTPSRRTVIPVPLLGPKQDDKDDEASLAPIKAAADGLSRAVRRKCGGAASKPSALRRVSDALQLTVPHGQPDTRGGLMAGHGLWPGLAPSTIDTGFAARPILGLLAGAGIPLGLYGGAKAVHALRARVHKDRLKSDLELARAEYERALAGVEDASSKTAASTSCALDQLAEKAATLGSTALTTALLSAGAGAGIFGPAVYELTRSRSDDKAVREAIERRRRQLYAMEPPEIVAVPVHAPRPPAPHRDASLGSLGELDPSRHLAELGRWIRDTTPKAKAANMGAAAAQWSAKLKQQKLQWAQMLRGDGEQGKKAPQPAAAQTPPVTPPSVRA